MPTSYAKDFYIWRFMGQNISSEDADAAFYQIRSVNWKIIHRYAKKTVKPGFSMADRCHRLKASQLPAKTAECSEIALTPYKFTQLEKRERNLLKKQLSHYEETLKWMDVMASTSPWDALIKSDSNTFFTVFNRCGGVYRAKYFNHPLPPRFIGRLKTSKRHRKDFAQTIKLIVTDGRLHELQNSLLGIDSAQLDHQSVFFLAMNALRHKKEELAKIYLADAYKKAWFRFDKDKVLFWYAMIDEKKKWLQNLSKSFDLNIYTLYAREKLKYPWPRIVNPSFDHKGCDYNISNPFEWLATLQNLKNRKQNGLIDEARRFMCSETEGHYAYIMERASHYKTHYFPMPYEKGYKNLSLDDKAIILSLARQESRFIPSSISPSYALGMMQIMPFLVEALAKKRGEKPNLDAMLNPYVNISYAKEHLSYLKRYLYNPLFIAYAYNGGIGFTKHLLTKRGMFKKGKFEPWLSMELVHYDESRRYGKKVLANYIVYRKLLGDPIGVASVVEATTVPSRTDRFRNR
ncbi:lytic transglycosylase domain-containing protein [Hydrogenimonas sp.]